MQQALALASVRQGFTAPNPAVGAVIVKNNQILAEGYHYAAGLPHAEIEAFKKISAVESEGADLFVTLEPCCHQGRTSPCVDTIITRGIRNVYYGLCDPNPKMAGQGIAKLQDAGIFCEQIPLKEIIAFYTCYSYWWQTGMPYATLKLAMSLDGKIAAEGGKPIAITGAIANRYTHELRKQADAILTTAKTVICDDPKMNVRLDNAVIAKPLYVLDRRLEVSLNARIFTTASKVTLFYQAEAANPEKRKHLEDNGVRCVAVNATATGLDLQAVLQQIATEGYYALSIETGAHCFEALIKAGLIQRVLLYVAPKVIGATAMPAFTAKENIFAKAKSIKWQVMGEDALCEILF